ncbi:hypothetical protein CEXT_235511 [Caerostris extrusa]|uniref:Ubiquitin-like protease family profile domain-containing protein n=1 Tax=Caerostris extrusa TaxID=172846 RepID=A0AAV4UJZ3_CAEEX|nr:hypothetical protein CEXT_235511 [Caerostris extrusa]
MKSRAKASIEQWVKGVDIFSKDFIVIPIYDNHTWYLAILCYPGMREEKTDRGETTRKEERGPDSTIESYTQTPVLKTQKISPSCLFIIHMKMIGLTTELYVMYISNWSSTARPTPGSLKKRRGFALASTLSVHAVRRYSEEALSNKHLAQVGGNLDFIVEGQASNMYKGKARKAVCISLLP